MASGDAPPLLLGVDLGAGSLKATLITPDGTPAGEGSHPVPTHQPEPGWSEQDPADWWTAMRAAVRAALAAAGEGAAARIAGIALSAGAHTQVLEDAEGRVIRRAILWNDQRSGAETRELRERADTRILEIGANRANPTWTLPQMLWLRRREPENFARVRRMSLAKDWLRARLTGTWETDTIDALGTLMLDAASARWSEELCGLIGWPMDTLPPIVAPTALVGRVTAEAAAETGLAPGTPVVCGSSDTAVETFGAGMAAEGLGVLKLATAATVSVLSRRARPDFELINYYHVVPEHWYVITGTNSCASAHRWLRDTFFAAEGFAGMEAQAASVSAGSEGLIFHPYLNGERSPHWDPLLRGSFVGLSFRHGSGHFARALYEGIAYSLRDCAEVFRARGLGFAQARLTGGGARSATWRQILADTLGVPVELPAVADASFGAALVAGLGVGIYADTQAALRQAVRVVARHEPIPANVAMYEEGFGLYRSAQRGLVAASHGLARMQGAR